MEERGRTKRLENGAGCIGQKDTVGAGAATGGAKRRNVTRNSKKSQKSEQPCDSNTLLYIGTSLFRKRDKGVPIIF